MIYKSYGKYLVTGVNHDSKPRTSAFDKMTKAICEKIQKEWGIRILLAKLQHLINF